MTSSLPDAVLELLCLFHGRSGSSWTFLDPHPARIGNCAHGGKGMFATVNFAASDPEYSRHQHSLLSLCPIDLSHVQRNIVAGERILAEVPLATWRVRADATNAEKAGTSTGERNSEPSHSLASC